MSATGNDTNILAVVAGCALTACVVGTRLISGIIGGQHAHAKPVVIAVVSPTVVAASSPVVHSFVPAQHQGTSGPAHEIRRSAPPSNTATTNPSGAPTMTPPTATIPAEQTIVSGNQATFISRTTGYTLSYPEDWTVNRSGQMYGVLAPDNNAGVVVSVEASDMLDTSGLETELISRLPAFLAQYGGNASSTPQFQLTSVDGVQGVVGTLTVDKNGLAGIASVDATYSNGRIYFVAGVVADQSADSASQDQAQVVTVMDSFHLR